MADYAHINNGKTGGVNLISVRRNFPQISLQEKFYEVFMLDPDGSKACRLWLHMLLSNVKVGGIVEYTINIGN